MSERKVLGRTIKVIRKAKGITQDSLAIAADMSPSHLQRIETGERQPTEAALLAVCKCLGIHPEDITYEVETLILVADPAHARMVRSPHSKVRVAA
jgi:transcriptional regulator with XRE-family HTH domain